MSIHRRTTKRHGTVYDVRLRDREGRTYNQTFRTMREAKAYEAKEIAARNRGTWIDPRRQLVTFGELATQWLEANPAKRPGSLARDESIVRVHLVPAIGGRQLASITKPDVQGLVNGWAQVMKPRTVTRTYAVLSAIFTYAVDGDYLSRTPCRKINLPAAAQLVRHVVDGDELARLVDALGEDFGPMALIGAVLGLRWGEVAGLRVRRLDFLRSTLAVAEQVTRGPKGTTVVGAPKSDAGRRTLAVPKPLMDLLSTLMARRGITAADPDAWLFPHSDGGPLDYNAWRRRVWYPACVKAGLGRWEVDEGEEQRGKAPRRYEGLSFHDLRRANATAMVLDGVDVKTAQARFGHSTIRLMLEVYAQVTTAADVAAGEKLGARFMLPTGNTRDERAMVDRPGERGEGLRAL